MVVENIRIRYSSGNGGGEYKDKIIVEVMVVENTSCKGGAEFGTLVSHGGGKYME